MAGGLLGKQDPKTLKLQNKNNNEVLQDSQPDYVPTPVKFNLKGILGLGQTIEINRSPAKSPENHWGWNHLQQEQTILFSQHQKELEKALQDLREEINKLVSATDNLDSSIEAAVINEIPEANEYQIGFLIRIRQLIYDVRQNISEAGLWVQAFAAKKKKRNYFWTMANNKKKGGTAFLYSDESGLARSAG